MQGGGHRTRGPYNTPLCRVLLAVLYPLQRSRAAAQHIPRPMPRPTSFMGDKSFQDIHACHPSFLRPEGGQKRFLVFAVLLQKRLIQVKVEVTVVKDLE